MCEIKQVNKQKSPHLPTPKSNTAVPGPWSQVSHRSSPTLSASFLYVASLCHNK